MAGISMAKKSNGEVWTWGYNGSGALGDNTLTDKSSPVAVVGSHSFKSILETAACAFGLKTDGSAWGWGGNFYGQMGNNANHESYSSPITVVGNHSFSKLGGGEFHAMFLKADGSIWGSGSNYYGQLGLNENYNSYSSPVKVIGNHSFVDVAGGSDLSLGLKANGEAWAWGDSIAGQTGHNVTTPNYSSPVKVVGNHSFVEIWSGERHVVALKGNGELWCWGTNLQGALGDNTLNNRSSPVAAVGGHSFTQVYASYRASFALKANGEAWAWGYNLYGQLGINTGGPSANVSSPIKVVGNHSFIEIMSGVDNHTYALKANGEVWCWGRNTQGQLGNNVDLESYSSPILVVGNHNFVTLFSEDLLEGAVCWGHSTGVTEENIRAFLNRWFGNGTISGSGDSEKITLESGQYMESENWNTGIGNVKIEVNKYQSGGTPTIYYKTSTTEGGVG